MKRFILNAMMSLVKIPSIRIYSLCFLTYHNKIKIIIFILMMKMMFDLYSFFFCIKTFYFFNILTFYSC